MILEGNLKLVEERLRQAECVLDVGGWYAPLNIATHVIDIQPYDTRRVHGAHFPERPERFTEDTWVVQDICKGSWPFPGKFFDFCFCSHLLEDVEDPVAVCREMIRVGKAGYIETPSRVHEIFTKERGVWLKMLLGGKPNVGDQHHHWMVEIEGGEIRFIPKTPLVWDRPHFISRGELGRKLMAEESGVCLWWEDTFSFRQMPEVTAEGLGRYKRDALRSLRDKKRRHGAGARPVRETRRRALFLALTDKLPGLFAVPLGTRLPTIVVRDADMPGIELDVLGRAGDGRCFRIVSLTADGAMPRGGNTSGNRIHVDAGRYRNDPGYRLRTNLMLRNLRADLAVCLVERPDPLVDYAVLAAISADARYAVTPRIPRDRRDDGAYYLSRFNGTQPRDRLVDRLVGRAP